MQKDPWVPQLKYLAIKIHKESPQLLILLCSYVMARGVLAQEGGKWRSLVGRFILPPWEVQEPVNEQGTLPLYLICFLILPARSAAWSACVGGMNLFFLCPHGRIRSNESVKQYLCLLGLFWPGTFHLIRTRCIRNKVFFSCHSSPTHFLQPLSSVNIWNFRIIQQNCVAEQLLKMGALQAGDASADFAWAVMNSRSVNTPGTFRGVFLCLDLRRFQCSSESVFV